RRGLEHQRDEEAVALPQGQLKDAPDLDPFQRALGVVGPRCAADAVDAKYKAEPVLTALAEAGPADRAAQHEFIALQARLLTHLAAQTRDDILAGVQLAAQTVVLAEVRILRTTVAMDEQHAPAIRRQDVTERGENRRVGHEAAQRRKFCVLK